MDTASTTRNKAGNVIGVKGGIALSEALKVNTTLETLNLKGENQQYNAEECNRILSQSAKSRQQDWR